MGFYGSKEPITPKNPQQHKKQQPQLNPEELCESKLNQVTQQIESAEKGFTGLEETSQKFINSAEYEPEELRKLKLDFRILSEQLMQDLLHTDGIQTPTEELRSRRKNVVQRIQNLHQKLDGILKSLPEDEGSPVDIAAELGIDEDEYNPEILRKKREQIEEEEEPVYNNEDIVQQKTQLDE